jgi:hypothetical protein
MRCDINASPTARPPRSLEASQPSRLGTGRDSTDDGGLAQMALATLGHEPQILAGVTVPDDA